MAGLDLSGVARLLDQWIVDEVEIAVDNGAAGATLDPATGKLTPAAPVVIYAGRGAVVPRDRAPQVADTDVQTIATETDGAYRLLLPLGAAPSAEPRAGMKVRVTEANGTTPDPLITQRRFEIVDLGEVSSFHVGRFLPLKQLGVAPAAGP